MKDTRSPDEMRSESRAKRYQYQSIARELLMNEGRKAGLLHPANFHRTCKCLNIPIGYTTINRSNQYNRAFYDGIPLCGSVWACPVCAAKVQERRRVEIQRAIEWTYGMGLKAVMVTLTFPHRAWQSLSDLISQQAYALEKLRAGEPWNRVKKGMGFEGLIRSLELTHGEAGWHPHSHEIWVVANDADALWLREKTMQRWKSACIKAELLDPSDESQLRAFEHRSVSIKDRVSCGEYLAKQGDLRAWGVDKELALSSTKEGRATGRHPFALLETATLTNRDGELFVEYATAMKGKRQIFWSHGLKGRVNVAEKKDEELLEEEMGEPIDVLAELSSEEWKVIIRENARAEILEIAEKKGFLGICEWFTRIKQTREGKDCA